MMSSCDIGKKQKKIKNSFCLVYQFIHFFHLIIKEEKRGLDFLVSEVERFKIKYRVHINIFSIYQYLSLSYYFIFLFYYTAVILLCI